MTNDCWIVLRMTDCSGHIEDIEVEGVFKSSIAADRYLGSLWRDYVSEFLDDDQANELDKLLDKTEFDLDDLQDFSNEVDVGIGPSFEEFMDEYSIVESTIM